MLFISKFSMNISRRLKPVFYMAVKTHLQISVEKRCKTVLFLRSGGHTVPSTKYNKLYPIGYKINL